MTNANLPERWLNDMRFRRKRLSDGAYRSYMNALLWSVANRTEGVIERGDLEDIPDFNPANLPELVRVELWDVRSPDRGWLIHDFDTTQTGKDLLAKYEHEKALDRKRKARKAREAAEAKLAAESDSTGNSTGSFPPESPSTDQTSPDKRTGGPSANPASNGQPGCQRCRSWVAVGDEGRPGDNPDWCLDCNSDARAEMAADAQREQA